MSGHTTPHISVNHTPKIVQGKNVSIQKERKKAGRHLGVEQSISCVKYKQMKKATTKKHLTYI